MFSKRFMLLVFSGAMSIIFVVIFMFNLSFNDVTHAQTIIYVKWDASGLTHNGSSWTEAYTDLQDAMVAANAGDEIWVAAGTYLPSQTGDRTISFDMKDGVALYGGFDGTENSREARDWETNPTILSGDLAGNDDQTNIIPGEATRSENSYHAVTSQDANYSAILDGFTITGGNTHTESNGEYANSGGGMLNIDSSPTIRHTIFISNTAHGDGGGMLNVNSHPVMNDIIFAHNTANTSGGGMSNIVGSNPNLSNVLFESNMANGGGGMFNNNNSPQLTNVSFLENLAYGNGGGMYNDTSNYQLNQVTLISNTANGSGGGIFNADRSNPQITQTIILSNTAINGGGMYNDDCGITLQYSTISYNNAWTEGGGVYNNGNTTFVKNTTFSHNSAGSRGGAMFNRKDSSDESRTTLNHVTVYSNTAVNGGGGIYDNGGNLTNIKSSIVANNTLNGTPSDCGGVLHSYGFNLIETVDNCTISSVQNPGTNLTGLDPLLLPMSFNGSTTLSHDLSAASPAIDQGDCTHIDGYTVLDDQRFYTRPFGANCDIGAVERTVFTITLPVIFKNYNNTPYFEGPWEQEPNDTPPDDVNGPIVSGRTYSGTFPSIDDEKDYFSIILPQANVIKIWLTNIPDGEDYDLILRDTNLSILADSVNVGNQSEYIETSVQPAGLYYIQVYNYKDTGNAQPYHLIVVYQ
ncbi:MAG: hypothetical protein GY803_01610 [Chloroflexi bacterium]|nr:hypothetical protein [Chloroflexota bacterium]